MRADMNSIGNLFGNRDLHPPWMSLRRHHAAQLRTFAASTKRGYNLCTVYIKTLMHGEGDNIVQRDSTAWIVTSQMSGPSSVIQELGFGRAFPSTIDEFTEMP
jgi:hypothetical protein